jgi:hypothetical protein
VAGQDQRRLPVTRLTDERPKAPWHPFPLVELCVLAGIVLIVLGLLNSGSDHGRAMLLCGLVLGSLGGFDTAAREHFAGFRSHSMMLAGVPAVGLAAILYFVAVPWPVVVVAAVLAFAGAVTLLARAYERRAG